MSHILHDITLYYYVDQDEFKKGFTLKQNIVSSLYVYFLKGYKPPKTTRISITLKDKGAKINDPIHHGSILNADALIDRGKFWAESNENQKQIILDTIHNTTLECADKLGWDKDGPDETFNLYDKIIDRRSKKIDADNDSIMKQALKVYNELMEEKKKRSAKSTVA